MNEDIKILPQMSEQIAELCAAMADLEGEVKQPELDCKVNYRTKSGQVLKYDYASLGEVQRVLKEPMKKSGIAIIQYDEQIQGKDYLVSMLTHKSGQWMKFYTPLFGILGNDPKAFGTAKTYARRYALYGIFNLYGQVDTDAQEIEAELKVEEAKADNKISEKQYGYMMSLLNKLPEYKKECEEKLPSTKCASFKEITPQMADQIIKKSKKMLEEVENETGQ